MLVTGKVWRDRIWAEGSFSISQSMEQQEKYAKWLQEQTSYDIAETKKARAETAAGYDVLILCGGIYASGIAGISFLRKNKKALQGKKAAVFCVGASPYDEKALAEIKAHNLKEDLKDIPVFYGRGAWMRRR